jgi:DNA-directed RNA polymerase specialized sigma24 family protein
MSEKIFYTKYQHGGEIVRVRTCPKTKHTTYELCPKDAEKPKVFCSARKLLIEIHGGKDLHITFDRYFKTGKYNKTAPLSQVTILDIFSAPKNSIITRDEIYIDPTLPKKKLGIDIEKRGHEVAKLFYAGFGSQVIKAGFDPEDVLQEVFRGLIARNRGTCPFDPDKASFGHYVHMVCNCIVMNIHRKEGKRRGREIIGLPTFIDGSWENADISANETLEAEHDPFFQDVSLKGAISNLELFIDSGTLPKETRDNAKRMIPLLLAGHTQNEIMERLDLSKSSLRRTLQQLRSEAHEWSNYS